MIFHILTIFPSFFDGPLKYGVVPKAVEAGRIGIRVHNLRDWAVDRHQTVDDRPFGGGEGMVLKVEPVFRALQSILPSRFSPPEEGNHGNTRVILLSAQGPRFHQAKARALLDYDEVLLLCGRYEGVDERITGHLVDEELSIGDFVLSGGARPADFNGWRVPEVLLQGNHAEIRRWRAAQALAKRQKNRPDLSRRDS